MRVCLIFEGSYPYSYGGVASWANQLIHAMSDIEFVLLTISPDSRKRGKFLYDIPENVKEIKELFLDEPQSLSPKRKYKFYFNATELLEIKKMLSCKDPDWDIVIDAFKKQKYPPEAFLMSKEFMDIFLEIMKENYERAPFTDTFYMVRSMMLPVLYILGKEAPKADVYHTICTGYAGLAAVVAHHNTRKPIINTEHGIYSREREEEMIRSEWVTADFKVQWINFFYMLSNSVYSRASKITSLFNAASKIQQDIGAPSERCMVISNGIDYEKFVNAEKKEKDGIIDIGAAVRFAKIKDIKTMIYAFYEVTKVFPNVRLHILGSDEDKEYANECRALIRSLGLDNVLTPGQVKDMVAYYGKLDFTILTSLSEGQPLTVLESFAAGRPSVTTDVGCCRELIYGANDGFGMAGYIAHPMDVDDIADKILLLCKNPEDIIKFGENGRKRVEAFYKRPEMIKK